MITRCLLTSFLFFVQIAKAQDQTHPMPDSLKKWDYDYLFDRIEDSRPERERSAYLKAFLHKAKNEKNWEELSNAYKNYVHYAPQAQKLTYADSMVMAAKRSDEDAVIGAAYLSKGVAYYGQKRLSDAMDSYLLADRHISKTADSYLAYKTKYHIAQIKYYLGYYEEAISIFSDCVHYFSSSDTRAYLNSLHSLGACYKLAGNHGKCTSINERGIAEGISRKNRDMEPYFVFSEGVNQAMIHNYADGIEKLQASMIGIRANRDFSNEMVGYFYLGKSYWGMDEKEKAVAYFKKLDALYDSHGYARPDIRVAYELLINYHKEREMREEQLYYVEKLLAVDRKLHRTYAYLQSRVTKEYDTKELMEEQRELKKALQWRRYNDRIFACILLSLLLFITYGIAKHKRNKREAKTKYDKLLQKIEEASKSKSQKVEDTESSMSKDAETAMLLALQKFENGKKFLESDLDLTKLAGHFNTNTKYLSQIIQRHRSKKFTEYINGLKIEQIAQRMRNERPLRNYTHEALAEEAGFSSTRRFVNAFIAVTGITPKYFIEELKKSSDRE